MCLGCQRVSRLVFTKWQDYVQIRKDEALLNARASLYHSKQLLQSVIIMHTPFTMTLSLSLLVSAGGSGEQHWVLQDSITTLTSLLSPTTLKLFNYRYL